MTNSEKMLKLNKQEREAFAKYETTKEAKYLATMRQCQEKRFKLLNKAKENLAKSVGSAE